MRLLLDSHTLIWAIYQPESLSGRVKSLLTDPANELVVSHATLWELLAKIGRGKLLLAGTSPETTLARILDLGVIFSPINLSLILAAASLPHHHSDPFDRMLIAQSIAENIPVLSADAKFPLYPIQVIWQ